MVSAETETELDCVVVDRGEDYGGGNNSGCSSNTVDIEQQPRDASPPPQSWLQRHLSSIGISTAASRLAAIVTLVFSSVVVWPTLTSAADARMSTALAKWSAQKDFLERCETHDWKPEGCAPLKDRPLPPPPTRFILLRRWLQGEPLDAPTHTTSFTLPALVYCAGLVCFTLALAKIVTTWRLYYARERAKHGIDLRPPPRSDGEKNDLQSFLEAPLKHTIYLALLFASALGYSPPNASKHTLAPETRSGSGERERRLETTEQRVGASLTTRALVEDLPTVDGTTGASTGSEISKPENTGPRKRDCCSPYARLSKFSCYKDNIEIQRRGKWGVKQTHVCPICYKTFGKGRGHYSCSVLTRDHEPRRKQFLEAQERFWEEAEAAWRLDLAL